MIGGSAGQIIRESISMKLKQAHADGTFKDAVLELCKGPGYKQQIIDYIKFKIRMNYKEYVDWFDKVLLLL